MEDATMSTSVEEAVKKFYDEHGWKGGEDQLFRQFRPAYKSYHEGTVVRTLACFEGRTGSLLIVGGGDLPQSHVDLSRRFASTVCIDISQLALDITRQKIPDAKTLLGSICDAPLESNTFDAIFSAHVIYHIDAKQQEQAVREMIRLTKPGGRVVVLYSNPQSPIRIAAGIVHRLKKMFTPSKAVNESCLYFSPHPIGWWSRFTDTCTLSFQPWDIIGSYEERTIIPTDWLAKLFYGTAELIEKFVPALAVRIWQYPIVILDKRTSLS
jgi:SAM-dependent methyltransferase